MRRGYVGVLFGCCLSLFVVAAGQKPSEAKGSTERRNLTVDDFFKLHQVSDPQISPEGEWVAYTVTSLDLQHEESKKRIWMVSITGDEAIPMTAKDQSSWHPRWSPDGKTLAFLSARDGEEEEKPKTQVWTLSRRGGEALQLTETIQDVEEFEWSPDSKRLVLVLQDPSPEELEAQQEKEKGITKTGPKTPRPWVVDRLQFKRDYVGYLDRRRTHLYALHVESRKLTQVTSGDFDDSDPVWSPDGRFLAFVSNRTEEPDSNFNTDIWVVAADNPDRGKNLIQVTTNVGEDDSPCWNPDGKTIAYLTQLEPQLFWYATKYLAVAPAVGGKPRLLTSDLDRNVIRPRFSSDGGLLYFLLEDDGVQHLASIPAAGGALQRLMEGRRVATDYDVGKDSKLVAAISDPKLPNEVFALTPSGLHRLTHTNDPLLAEIRLGDVDYVRFKSKDGTQVSGYLFKPPSFSPELRYPTLLHIHGGPVAQYDAEFSFLAQLYAANGYLVLEPNPRGSSGYGQDFCKAIFADWGNKDYEDVMAMVDYAIEHGLADPDRLGVGGWSYGGILTNHVLIRTDRFKAAISGASDFLYVTGYGHDHYQREWELELGLPWKNRELWDRLSPFYQVEKIVTPTLVIGGEKDWNVPIIKSEQLYQALKRLDRTTELVVYPGEHHGIRKPSYQKDRFERFLAWYDKYLKGSETPDAANRCASCRKALR